MEDLLRGYWESEERLRVRLAELESMRPTTEDAILLEKRIATLEEEIQDISDTVRVLKSYIRKAGQG